MSDVLQAVVLGLVQGLTEFIPVSSSGHLVLVPHWLGWETPGLAFDVALHMGTLAAVLVYFRAELLAMAKGALGLDRTPQGQLYRRLLGYLVVASVPIAIVGLVFEEQLTAAFDSPLVASLALFGTAALLVLGERVRDRRTGRGDRRTARVDPIERPSADASASGRVEVTAPPGLPTGADPTDPRGTTLAGLGLRQAVQVGLGQCVALLPGISRSGTTITAGMVSGLTRPAATRLSFLLFLPAAAGAALLSLPDLAQPGPMSGVAILWGVVAAFVSGLAAITFLVALVARRGLGVFAIYCVAVGSVGLVTVALG